MALNHQNVGRVTDPYTHEYTWKDVALYGLGIGAKREELDYLYEAKGPAVYPTFSMVPTLPSLSEALSFTGGKLESVLHGAETIVLHRPIPPEGTAKSVSTLTAIHDAKKFAVAKVTTRTEVNGALTFETEADVIYRGEGGFGGEPPPKLSVPALPEGREPTFVYKERIGSEQALMYRLSGDENPLHVDPDVARAAGFPRPILHGLCTYGFCCRAVLTSSCGGSASRLKAFSAQFRKPVYPGEVLTTHGWDVGDGTVLLRAFTSGDKAVIANGWAEILAA